MPYMRVYLDRVFLPPGTCQRVGILQIDYVRNNFGQMNAVLYREQCNWLTFSELLYHACWLYTIRRPMYTHVDLIIGYERRVIENGQRCSTAINIIARPSKFERFLFRFHRRADITIILGCTPFGVQLSFSFSVVETNDREAPLPRRSKGQNIFYFVFFLFFALLRIQLTSENCYYFHFCQSNHTTHCCILHDSTWALPKLAVTDVRCPHSGGVYTFLPNHRQRYRISLMVVMSSLVLVSIVSG